MLVHFLAFRAAAVVIPGFWLMWVLIVQLFPSHSSTSFYLIVTHSNVMPV